MLIVFISSRSRPSVGGAAICLSVVIGRQFCHQKGKLFTYIHPDEELLQYIGMAVGESENDVDDSSRPAQGRECNFHCAQGSIARKLLRRIGINGVIPHSQVIESA